MSYDVRIDPTTGDLPEVSAFVRDAELVAQRARVRLGTHGPSAVAGTDGEWILDRFAGLPFIDWRHDKPPDTDAIAVFVANEIATTPGVLRVDEVQASFNKNTRRVSVSGKAFVADGDEDDVVSTQFVVEVGGNTTPAIAFFYARDGVAI
jgi:hypothetical protein